MNKADLDALEALKQYGLPEYVHPVLLEAVQLMNRKALDYNGRVDADPARRD